MYLDILFQDNLHFFVLVYNMEKTMLSHNEWVVHYLIFQFVVAISSVDFNDKLILDLSGKKFIMTALLWKQLP